MGQKVTPLKFPIQAIYPPHLTFLSKLIYMCIWKQITLTSGQTYHWQFYMDSTWGALLRSEAISICSYSTPLGGKVISYDYSCLIAQWPTSISHSFPISWLSMNASGLATIHLTFKNGIGMNIHATAGAKFNERLSWVICLVTDQRSLLGCSAYKDQVLVQVWENKNNYLCYILKMRRWGICLIL